MRKLASLTFAAALTFSTAAFAQTDTVTVDLSGISDDLAAELGIDVDDLPSSIDLPADVAAEVCGADVASLGDTCVAIVSTGDLTTAIESEIDGAEGNGAENSAREFAPGQQDGPARDAAPGQQDGPAKDFAPGQVKKSGD